MRQNTPTDLVTGALSHSGAQIAERLLDSGRGVRTLTFHPGRPHPLRARVDVREYRFDDPSALARSLEGVNTLYNTFWVRFDHGRTSFANAIESSRMLFFAARRAGVQRIVHLSITNPSLESPLPYFRGKALVEYALAQSGVPYSIVRPTWIFGGERDVLANNIAWILRRMPAFALPGDGAYPVQPVHVEDLARICTDAGSATGDIVIDAAGPETMSFRDLVALVRAAVDTNPPILRVPPAVMAAAARALGLLVGDVVLTGDEIRGLMAGLLTSNEPPRGQIAFSQWLNGHAASLGRSYANEVRRHFAGTATPRDVHATYLLGTRAAHG
jgi:NADH dehydrogenase